MARVVHPAMGLCGGLGGGEATPGQDVFMEGDIIGCLFIRWEVVGMMGFPSEEGVMPLTQFLTGHPSLLVTHSKVPRNGSISEVSLLSRRWMSQAGSGKGVVPVGVVRQRVSSS